MMGIAAIKPVSSALHSQLLLVINETIYRIEPIFSRGLNGLKAFRLNKPDGTLYDVAETRYGPQCDCPDFIFRRDGIDPLGCKHVRSLVAEGLIGGGASGPSRAPDRA